MISLLNKFLLSGMLLMLLSCGRQRTASAEEYRALIAHNDDLTKSKEFGQIHYSATYIPGEIIALRNIAPGQAGMKDSLRAGIAKTKNTIYFSLTIADAEGSYKIKEQINSKQDYGYDLSYFSQVIQENLQLELSDEEYVSCAFVHMEPVTSLKPVFKFFIAFDTEGRKMPEKGFTFVLNDHLFRNGRIKLFYSKDIIGDLPVLNS